MSEGQSLRGLHLFLKEDILLLLEAISFSISIFNFHGVHKPSFFRALVNAPITAPIVTPAAKTMAVTANPYFFKISVSHSRSGSFSRSFSFCSSRAATFCLSSSTFHVLSPLFPVGHFHCLQYLHLPLFLHCTCRLLLDFGQYTHVLTDRERL